MAISKIGVQATGFAEANVGLQIPNISLENRAAEAANGTIFFNTSNNAIEVYANGAWSGIGSSVPNPTISDVTGTIDSGNTGSKISIVGANFDIDNALLQGTLRFNYNGTTDVTVTPNTSTAINDVSIPSEVLSQAANTSGTLQFIRSDGSLSNSFSKPMSANVIVTIDYLVVAGGGGGGISDGASGAGGAGGLLTGSGLSILGSPSTYTVTVGAGGTAKTVQGQGNNGSNSVFSVYTAIGGGGGGGGSGPGQVGKAGGSGGGGCYGASLGGAGVPGQGNNGGTGAAQAAAHGTGGGGGAGAQGATGTTSIGGAGGAGAFSSITGTPVAYAGGGGGGNQDGTYPVALGGTGGGGNSNGPGTPGSNGTVNTGGGAGGVAASAAPSKAGGSGVVIIKHLDTKSISNPGGGLTFSTSTGAPGYNVTTFTAGTGSISIS